MGSSCCEDDGQFCNRQWYLQNMDSVKRPSHIREGHTILQADKHQSITSSYHHQSNGQVEACIKFVKHTNKKCLDTCQDVRPALLQIWSTLIGMGPPSPTTLLFNRLIKGLLLQMHREPININNDDAQYEALEACQNKYIKKNDTQKRPFCFFL